MKKIVSYLLLLFLFSCAATKINKDDTTYVVLLSGQSNMVGHGNYDDIEDSIKKRIEKIGNRVLLTTSKKEAEPLSYYTANIKKYNFTKHFGPELFVGLTLAEKYPNKKFLLIKKAVGGTSLCGAWNPNWTQEKADISERGAKRKKLKLFSEHIENINLHLNNLKKKGQNYKVIGALWLQGESDTNKKFTATSYQKNLQNLVASYREELKSKDLPFVIGQINALPRKYKIGPKQVREAMQNLADSDNAVAIINTKHNKPWSDYPKHSDDLHYNTTGQINFGVAFAQNLIVLIKI